MENVCAWCKVSYGLPGYPSALHNLDACRAILEAKVRFLDLQVEELRAALDRDKTGLGEALSKVLVEVGARRWVVEGRGSYNFDDDGYRRETGWALDAIEKLAREALAASGRLAHEALKPKDTVKRVCCCVTATEKHFICPVHGECEWLGPGDIKKRNQETDRNWADTHRAGDEDEKRDSAPRIFKAPIPEGCTCKYRVEAQMTGYCPVHR